MDELLKFAPILSPIGAAFGVFAYLLWQDWRSGKLTWGKKESGGAMMGAVLTSTDPQVMSALEQISGAMAQLQGHFNDETTAILTEMQITLRNIYACVQKIDGIMGDVRNTQREILRYGVPTRSGPSQT